MRERAATVDKITKMRLDQLLPFVMRETGFDMWIIICNEDNYDPVFKTMIPYDAWCPITQILVFYDPGEGKDVERLNISRTNMKGLHEKAWQPPHTRKSTGESQWECLARIVRERDPRKMGINESDVIWAADGLTVSLKKKLVKTIGQKYAQRLHSAEKMVILWLETLLDEELDLYNQAVAISHALIAKTFSNEVITPGVTTTDDLAYYYRQKLADLGLQKSFRPSFRILGRHPEVLKKYSLEDKIIRRGDVLHCDVGLIYLRYHTDTQEMAYVLRRGEEDVPPGLKAGIAEGNRLQDIYCSEFKEGLTGNQLLANILKRAKEKGIKKPRVYSHSVGYYLHEPGPLIGLPWEQVNTGPRGEVRLVYNSCFTVELSVDCPVEEWSGQELRFKLEQDIVFTKKGVFYLDGRQTKFHIVH
ncbi:aminopeptidase P family protein [Candidatus Aminicenantes bacterium AC-334-K16]|nr:aminopeptidase P family protein [Candidatus Aminicenantes bacterium AC-334-K16]